MNLFIYASWPKCKGVLYSKYKTNLNITQFTFNKRLSFLFLSFATNVSQECVVAKATASIATDLYVSGSDP
jgi:hypothetical protein